MPAGPPVSNIVVVSYTGELLSAVAEGLALTTTVVLAAGPVQPLVLITVRV
jgi:hypothetical protein